MREHANAVTVGILALFLEACCMCGPTGPSGAPQGATGYMPIGATPAATWEIEGQSYDIQSTYYLVLEQEAMYTIELRVPPAQIPTRGFDEATAAELALPLMLDAVRSGRHRRLAVQSADGVLPVRWIGVVLLTRTGIRSSGFRTRRALGEIEALLGADGGARRP